MRITQYEVEKELGKIVDDVCRQDIAASTGIYPTVVYGYFNPNDERKSPYFETLLIQAHVDAKNPECGARLWEAMNRLREMSLSESRPQCVATEMAKSIKEDADVHSTHVSGASLYDQLKEVDESIRQKENVRAAILEAINAEKETFNGTRNRLAVLPSHIQNKAKRRAV